MLQRRYNLKMIASFKHNFVFLKTMKTAGTSIELALGPLCGPGDIISPISASHDIRRFADSGVFARHFASPEVQKHYMKRLRKGNRKLLSAMLRDKSFDRLRAHSRPLRVKKWVGTFWDSAYRFTVDRHPYEKAVSLAAMNHRDLDTTVFLDRRYTGHQWYLEGGKLIVDRVMMYDRLSSDFAQVLADLGMPNIELPRSRHADRDRSPAREQLTAAQRAFIYEQCAPEFELFGWDR